MMRATDSRPYSPDKGSVYLKTIILRRNPMKKTFVLDEIDCANCAAKFERAVSAIDGVKSAGVNFFAQKLIVEIDDGREDAVTKEIVKVAKKVVPDCEVVL